MPTAFYASRIGPTQAETPSEGYRLCRGVRICRTGSQPYRGRELKGHPDYDPSWGLRDDALYDVHRPLSEVTSPETIASFEGKSVTLGHPPDHVAPGSLISRETERELGCGHAQNVRVGPALADGSIPLIADLVLKDDDLIDRVDAGVRDISAGYTYRLRRLTDGRLVQRAIRGNHIAVVERGRAGRSIAIQDAAPHGLQRPMLSKADFFNGVTWEAGQTALERHLAADPDAPELSPMHFFAGVSHAEGKRKHDAYLALRRG